MRYLITLVTMAILFVVATYIELPSKAVPVVIPTLAPLPYADPCNSPSDVGLYRLCIARGLGV